MVMEGIIDAKKIKEFESYLISEEKSKATVMKYTHDVTVVYAAHSAPTARTFSTTLAVHSAPLANI